MQWANGSVETNNVFVQYEKILVFNAEPDKCVEWKILNWQEYLLLAL